MGQIEHPDYYGGKIEVIDFIEDHNLGFHLGNVVKYITRAGKKDKETELEDLKKARFYLDLYIEAKMNERRSASELSLLREGDADI